MVDDWSAIWPVDINIISDKTIINFTFNNKYQVVELKNPLRKMWLLAIAQRIKYIEC